MRGGASFSLSAAAVALLVRALSPPPLFDTSPNPGPRLGSPARPGTMQRRRRKLARRTR